MNHDDAEPNSERELRAEREALRLRLAEIERRLGEGEPWRPPLDAAVEGALAGAVGFAVVLDLAGRVSGWNAGARNVFGWDEAEILGRDAALIWTPEDRREGVPEREMRLAREQGHAAEDRWHLRKDGTRIWVGGEMLPMRGPDGALSGYCKVMRDRTEARRDAERSGRHRSGRAAHAAAGAGRLCRLNARLPGGVERGAERARRGAGGPSGRAEAPPRARSATSSG